MFEDYVQWARASPPDCAQRTQSVLVDERRGLRNSADNTYCIQTLAGSYATSLQTPWRLSDRARVCVEAETLLYVDFVYALRAGFLTLKVNAAPGYDRLIPLHPIHLSYPCLEEAGSNGRGIEDPYDA